MTGKPVMVSAVRSGATNEVEPPMGSAAYCPEINSTRTSSEHCMALLMCFDYTQLRCAQHDIVLEFETYSAI
jgi:hypothetical protein